MRAGLSRSYACWIRPGTPDVLRGQVSAALDILRGHLCDLRDGRVPLESLLVGKNLSQELAGYRVPSPGARAALQLQAAGKPTRPGQRIKLLFTRDESGVHAWNLPTAAALLQHFGVTEEDLRVHVRTDLGEQLALPMHAWNRQRMAAESEISFFRRDSLYALPSGL